MFNARRGTPGFVGGGPDNIPSVVGQLSWCAQVVRVDVVGTALQWLG